MAKKASGQELIEHKSFIFDNIGEHFNNPDISDVTLTVGDQMFAAHRLILATQSKVFMTMLMGESWKESEEKEIALQESPEGEAAFSDILKFFYTGTLTVCGIHTLADKYDVSVLKDDCVNFMKEVLTGVHGDALEAGLEWLQYMETFLPDLVSLCYSAIKTNFTGITCNGTYDDAVDKLTSTQLETTLKDTHITDEIALVSERGLLTFADAKVMASKLLPYVRFHNIDVDDLESVGLGSKNDLTEYYNKAYKVHAERSKIASRACKKRRLSDGLAEVTCSCDAMNGCVHINPRHYFEPPYGKLVNAAERRLLKQEAIDLSDLAAFSQKRLFPKDIDTSKSWGVKLSCRYASDPIFERYIIVPAKVS